MTKYIILIILVMPHISFAGQEISNLVTPVHYFVDRIKQLNQMNDNLIKYRQVSIVGTSGIGKTQVARMYAYENKDSYDLIWFIDCNLDINEELLKLAKAINVHANKQVVSEDIRQIRDKILDYLSTKDKWLLVFDNLKIKGNRVIKEFTNWEHNGDVIFCSQDSELLPNVVRMTSFDTTDSMALAKNILESDTDKSAEFLAQEFKDYPVLIVQGAQLLQQVPGLGVEEYKKKISNSADKIKLNVTLAIHELKPSAR